MGLKENILKMSFIDIFGTKTRNPILQNEINFF